jgi:hypothetical protein
VNTRTKVALAFGVLGGIAAIYNLGERVSVVDIAVGALLNFGIVYGIGSLIAWFRARRTSTKEPVPTSARQVTSRAATSQRSQGLASEQYLAQVPTAAPIKEQLAVLDGLFQTRRISHQQFLAKRREILELEARPMERVDGTADGLDLNGVQSASRRGDAPAEPGRHCACPEADQRTSRRRHPHR